ncbi:Uncharacterised protein [Haploplasma axanthum]|uniref:Uncharacterized protein n=1 Tax=Haploplasma axanthum TaxID=29552 RepID=A0A449BBP7_HAPAX|nr:Uncharacterised protein [Haploplasma axanthum]
MNEEAIYELRKTIYERLVDSVSKNVIFILKTISSFLKDLIQ